MVNVQSEDYGAMSTTNAESSDGKSFKIQFMCNRNTSHYFGLILDSWVSPIPSW